MPQVPRPRRRGARQREVQEREGLFVKIMGEETMTGTKMSKPDTLERLRKLHSTFQQKETSRLFIIACAEVLREMARDKKLGRCCVTTLLYMNRALRSIVEEDNSEERYDCVIHGLQVGPDCPRC